ncbi:putative selenoprotein [Rubrobacter marinus]|uniref:Putative selenoprotein n=1 Tax=Rubrobacter marinus TaxID=2653852 RepID=A0A6G8Q1F6_9ACTN|nr:YbdD/YjiX family protein [Rubrobacter marinus]QIN80314.1 putative selenoprotein [Rubrobacter marinus]
MSKEAVLAPLRYAWGYLKEISGENAYDRYLAVHARTHGDEVPMDRGEFYRWRQDEKFNNPGSRCP